METIIKITIVDGDIQYIEGIPEDVVIECNISGADTPDDIYVETYRKIKESKNDRT